MIELFVLMLGGIFFVPALVVASAIGIACWAGWIAVKTVWYLFWGFAFAVLMTIIVVPLVLGGMFAGLMALIF